MFQITVTKDKSGHNATVTAQGQFVCSCFGARSEKAARQQASQDAKQLLTKKH